MKGMMTASVSAGSSHRVARLTCTPHVSGPSGAAWSGVIHASVRSPSAQTAFMAVKPGQVFLYRRRALSQSNLRLVSGFTVDQLRMLSTEFGNWHSAWG